jgi:hypothetical protein
MKSKIAVKYIEVDILLARDHGIQYSVIAIRSGRPTALVNSSAWCAVEELGLIWLIELFSLW